MSSDGSTSPVPDPFRSSTSSASWMLTTSTKYPPDRSSASFSLYSVIPALTSGETLGNGSARTWHSLGGISSLRGGRYVGA
eukprot:7430603-Alexandrium_andersonii.AAC.1